MMEQRKPLVSQMLNKVDLVDVTIESHLGSNYSFPGMDRKELEMVLPKLSGRIPAGQPSLLLINSHFSTLAIPYRVIKSVLVNGEIWWKAPSTA